MPVLQPLKETIGRAADSHVRIAVTGLSRAGKTAFITSLVNQLLHVSRHDNLPFLSAARDKRIIAVKRTSQRDIMVPSFEYDAAMDNLTQDAPIWPEPTRDVSELRLAVKYRTERLSKRISGKTHTLYIDIVDYPGEWLLDLPLLNQSFEQWSEMQLNALHGLRKELAQPWLDALPEDPNVEANDKEIAHWSSLFANYLSACKAQGLHWVQPGRFILPGELAGAPILQFFPLVSTGDKSKYDKGSIGAVLKSRFEEYKSKIVKRFYKEYFSGFDRQVVLADVLHPLNEGFDPFMDMRSALEQILESYRYGKNGILKRVFSPRIDRVLFAATKCDHVTPEQAVNMASLLSQMVGPVWNRVAFEGIEQKCMSVASIKATDAGFVDDNGEKQPVIKGVDINQTPMVIFPGDVPKRLPNREFWQKQGFQFPNFSPPVSAGSDLDKPLPHIRLDAVLEYLIGDKLR